MTHNTKPQLFHSLTFADAVRGAEFLRTLGFQEVSLDTNENDPSVVEHAQYQWRDNGGVMFGSVRENNPHAQAEMVGQAKCYLVVGTDSEVDDVFHRALAAHGTVIAEPTDQDYGGRSATIADPEGNQWSVGSYPGE
ncbi:VOC family protein [Kocuria carniphila]|uniref:VOC family protein n=1 Tax=Kocuria carniphila TaxID=262208 RepID=A0ABV3V1X0_9MICC|nr:VOC family protein [Kocuria carniphila]MCT1801825.1 VOC family protein [Kocuria carniphila]PZP31122.1 MAG: bleomycin resistance protein [Kocuria rhizophila]